jgi:hypothetical protein
MKNKTYYRFTLSIFDENFEGSEKADGRLFSSAVEASSYAQAAADSEKANNLFLVGALPYIHKMHLNEES